jgi:hypothetical protein
MLRMQKAVKNTPNIRINKLILKTFIDVRDGGVLSCCKCQRMTMQTSIAGEEKQESK